MPFILHTTLTLSILAQHYLFVNSNNYEAIHTHIKSMSILAREQSSSNTIHTFVSSIKYISKDCISENDIKKLSYTIVSLSELLELEQPGYKLFNKQETRFGATMGVLELLVTDSSNYFYNLLFVAFIYNVELPYAMNIFDVLIEYIILYDLSSINRIIEEINGILAVTKSILSTTLTCLRFQMRIKPLGVLKARFDLNRELFYAEQTNKNTPLITLIKEIETKTMTSSKSVDGANSAVLKLEEGLDELKKLKLVDTNFKNELTLLFDDEKYDYRDIKENLLVNIFGDHLKDTSDLFVIKNKIKEVLEINKGHIGSFVINQQRLVNKQIKTTMKRLNNLIRYFKSDFVVRFKYTLNKMNKRSFKITILEYITEGFMRLQSTLMKINEEESI